MATESAVHVPANEITRSEAGSGKAAGTLRIGRDLVLLLARVGLGILMIWHAKMEWDFGGGSVSGVGALFAHSNVPFPTAAAAFNLGIEFIGGILVIAGAALPLIGVAMAANMVGAWVLVHTGGLYSMEGNGPELVIAIGLLSLVFAVVGSGRLGVDHWVARWYRNRKA
jgi:putative oxidoreductase